MHLIAWLLPLALLNNEVFKIRGKKMVGLGDAGAGLGGGGAGLGDGAPLLRVRADALLQRSAR
jgi:hypothetical protein